MRHKAYSIGVFFLVILGGALVSCTRESTEGDSDDSTKPVVFSEVERGPVKLRVEVDPAEPRLSDEPLLTIEIKAHVDVDVEDPPFGESIAGFKVRDFRKSLPKIEGDRKVYRQTYTLEPERAGEHVIFPIPVRFTDNRADGDGETRTVESESVVVMVQSMSPDQVPSLDDLRSPADPLPLPKKPLSPWFYSLAAIPVIGGLLVWWLKRRPRKEAPEKKLSPRELAYLELERLLEADWVTQGQYQTFYVELTLIVRRYIERTTDIRAPEQTTDEFLTVMRRSEAIPDLEKDRLRAFLESADLVKFAGWRPNAEQIEESFERAKSFVGLDVKSPAEGAVVQ